MGLAGEYSMRDGSCHRNRFGVPVPLPKTEFARPPRRVFAEPAVEVVVERNHMRPSNVNTIFS
jgi:hypothetical protein